MRGKASDLCCVVFGLWRHPGVAETKNMTPSPLSPYAVTKLTCEHYMKVFASVYGLETLALRYFNVFGPGQLPDGAYAAAIPRFVYAALHDQPLTIYGDGEQTRDFCFINNTVSANLLAASCSKKLTGQVVNIAGGRRIVLNGLVKELEAQLGFGIKVDHVAPRTGDIRDSLADITRARDLLGYEPKVKWKRRLLRRSLSCASSKSQRVNKQPDEVGSTAVRRGELDQNRRGHEAIMIVDLGFERLCLSRKGEWLRR
ncbi:MAG: NAD-dependent epimerase/dehydratase family protein [Polyangiaceae bacterium]